MTVEFVRVKEERDWEDIENQDYVRVKQEKDIEDETRDADICTSTTSENTQVYMKEKVDNDVCQRVMEKDGKDNTRIKIEREDLDSGFEEHEFKGELVLEPERLQMQNVAFKSQGTQTIASNSTQSETNRLQIKIQECWSNDILNKSSNINFGNKNCTLTFEQIADMTKEPQKTETNSIRKSKTHETHFECDTCAKRFTRKSNLALHMQIHMGVVQYTCEVCKKQLSNYFNLKRHRYIHTGEKPHCCDVCDRRFADPCNLVTHKRIHSRSDSTELQPEKKYKCKICIKQFTSPSHLDSHVRVHTGEKPFPCNQCEKQFTSAYNLKRHKWVHTGETPKKTCDVCNKQFVETRCLAKHMQLHTGVVTIFECDVCKKTFNDARTRMRHKQTHNGNKFTCEICKKTYLSTYAFTKHKTYHKMRAEGRYDGRKYIRVSDLMNKFDR